MLTWVEGKREFGCAYHKVAWFHVSAADGHIDVFVMPKISERRPIAVTLKVTPKGGVEKDVKVALENVSGTGHLHDALAPVLTGAGISSGMAGAFVADIISVVTEDAKTIQAAMSSRTVV